MRALALLLVLAATPTLRADRMRDSMRMGGRAPRKHANSAVEGALVGAPFPLGAQCTGSAALQSTIGDITFTRASSAYCPKSDGTYVLVGNNIPRIGRQGLLIEGPATQLLTSPRDLTNVIWIKVNATVAKNAMGADGVAASASTITATGANATVLQTTVLAGGTMRGFTGSVHRVTGVGTIEVTSDNGDSWLDITARLATATGCTWLRFDNDGDTVRDSAATRCTIGWGALAQTIANPVVGFRITTSGDAIAVDFTQLEETDSSGSSPIVATTRAADKATFDTATFPVAAGGIEFRFTPNWLPARLGANFKSFIDSRSAAGTGEGLYLFVRDTIAYHGVRNAGAATGVAANIDLSAVPIVKYGTPRTWRLAWDSTSFDLRINGVVRSATATPNVPGAQMTALKLSLYDNPSSLWPNGWFSDIKTTLVRAETSTRVATIGDSVITGAWDVLVADAMQTRVPRKFITPYSASGATIANTSTQYTTNVQGLGFTAVVVGVGINDLIGGTSGATAWGNLQTLLTTIISDGLRPVVVNVTPCGGYGSCTSGVDDERVAFNGLEATWCASHAATATCVNADLLLRNPGVVNQLLASCQDDCGAFACDSLHPDNSCSVVYANAIADALP